MVFNNNVLGNIIIFRHKLFKQQKKTNVIIRDLFIFLTTISIYCNYLYVFVPLLMGPKSVFF